MKTLKRILKLFLVIIAVPVICFAILILYAVLSDYKPDGKTTIAQSDDPSAIMDSVSFTLLTWNIGYAGLDSEMDFFKDGGTKVITPKEVYPENIAGISDFLAKNDTIDFILLQEIDRNSKRSFHDDQYEKISAILPEHYPFFATNYKVFFVPVPPSTPMGKVLSGIATFSDFQPVSSERHSLPGDFGFPTQLFYLDRCFMVNRYKVENGRELVVINTHNEAFDEGGTIRKDQMEELKKFVLNEYNNGNYVIAGGDWNQYPPDFKPAFEENKVFTGIVGGFNLMGIENDYMPDGWKWLYDPTTPSFRTLVTAYDPEETPTSVCDFFLISPNIECDFVKCHQLGFEFSDHHPVSIRVGLF